MISTVIADDHPIVRQGIRTLLKEEGGCRIVGEATDGRTALDLIVTHRPQIAVLDVQLPDLSGLEVARRTQVTSAQTRVIMLSMYDDAPYLRDAQRAGAMGYVLKAAATTDLLLAMQAVMGGHHFLSAPLVARADAACHPAAEESGDPYDLLTPRECEVLQLAAQGASTAEIGERLVISPRTAETHRANLLRELSLKSQTDLIRFAVRRGLLT